MPINNNILNQKGTPAFYSDIFANRPAFGYAGRVFISTDTGAIYEDTGTSWTLIADAGAGTTGTLQQVTTNGNTTTLGIVVDGININNGAGTGIQNTAIGTSSLNANTNGSNNTAIGFNSLLNNTSGQQNTGVGRNSLAANTTGGSNTAIGSLSLALNTTGDSNTAIGYVSLQANTTGANNVAVGQSSLTANTTGFSNVGIGSRALEANTTGAQNVAIGTDALYINTTGNTNTAIGTAALSLNTTGGGNTAIGTSALNSNTTANFNTAVGGSSLAANTTGTSNVAIGYLSLNANTTATGNTAIGSQSLYLNTTGASNTAIGVGALQNNTTASTNTAIGSSALQNNSTGTQNTAIGSSALGLNTTAGDNTSIGFAAMQFNTTGTGNTAIGSSSLRANTTFNFNTALGGGALTNALASANTAVGYGTLQSTTGGNNTAIGNISLQNNTTGTLNTAVGVQSLAANTTGTGNTAIGSTAGGSITTGSNNTILGNYTGTTTLASNIVLSDGAGNVRLFSDANGLIGINQAVGSTIGGQLDIHTTQTYALVLNGLTTNNAYTAYSNNSVGKWRIGNTYNAGANSFDIFNLGTSSNALSINSTTNNIGIGISSASYSKLDVNGQSIFRGGAILSSGTALKFNNYYNAGTGTDKAVTTGYSGQIYFDTSSGYMSLQSSSSSNATDSNVTIVEKFRLANTGNLLLGAYTDDTINKLQVSGNLIAYTSNTCNQTNSVIVNNGATATFTLNSITGYGYGIGDNVNGIIVISINQPTATSLYNSAVYLGTIINPRGSNATITQISQTLGLAMLTLVVTNSGNSIIVTPTSSTAATLRVTITFIGGGGLN